LLERLKVRTFIYSHLQGNEQHRPMYVPVSLLCTSLCCRCIYRRHCVSVLLTVCRKGEVGCCEEIKAFAVKHNIKQQQIAVLAGLCSIITFR